MFRFESEKLPIQDHTPFFEAVSAGDLIKVKGLISKYKININAVDKYGWPALSLACANLRTGIVKFLLKNGADINIYHPCRITAETTALDYMLFVWLEACGEGKEKRRQQAENIIQLLWDHQPRAHLHCFCNHNSRELFGELLQLWWEKSHKKLITADFSNRDINDNDLGNLADTLEDGGDRFISTLNLSNNSFSHSGLSDLANSLKNNNTLQTLNLSNNKHIGCRSYFSSGFQNLINALFKNKKLEYLNIKNCPLDQADINTLLNFLKNRPHDSKLQRIDFDISDTVLTALPISDQAIIRATQKRSCFIGVINQCQDKLMKHHPYEKKTAILLEKSIEYLNTCKDFFSGEEIDPYLDGVAVGLMKFIDVASKNNSIDLIRCFDEVLKIIDFARTSTLLKITNEYDTENNNSMDVFRCVFENNMNALCVASWAIHSQYVQSQVVTPTEKMINAAKNIILGLSGFSKIIEGSGQLAGFIGEHLNTVIEGAGLISKTTEVADILSDIHYGLDETKDTIIRKIHGATIGDTCKNLVYCFKNVKTALSKITAITYAILHHYEDGINGLSPKEATTIAKYAFLHIAGLLMSGVISISKSKRLTADSLIEEVISYLSYASIRETVIRVEMMTNIEKQFAEKFFMLPRLKFYSKENHANILYCTANTQDAYLPARWATQAEIAALNDLLSMKNVDREISETVSTHTSIKHSLIFSQRELVELEKHVPLETKLSPYKSKHKEINELKRQLNSLMWRDSQEAEHKSNQAIQHKPT